MRSCLILCAALAACSFLRPRAPAMTPSLVPTPAIVDSVVIVVKASELFAGDDADISAMRIDHGRSVSCDAEFESLNPDVATVDRNTTITAHKAGSATVQATCLGKRGAITVRVSPRP